MKIELLPGNRIKTWSAYPGEILILKKLGSNFLTSEKVNSEQILKREEILIDLFCEYQYKNLLNKNLCNCEIN